MTAQEGLITTRFRAMVAVAVTGWFFAVNLYDLTTGRPSSWTLQFTALLPNWAAVAATIALYAYITWLGVAFTLDSPRNGEKALIATFTGCAVIGPLGALLPRFLAIVHVAKTSLMLTAFPASIALLLSFHGQPKEEPSATGTSAELTERSRH